MAEQGLWIPPAIWCDGALSLVDKTILATVHSFDANGLSFYQTNQTIADTLGVSTSTVKRAVKNLLDLGKIEMLSFDGRKRQIMLTKVVQNELAGGSQRPSRGVKLSHQKGQNEPAGGSKRTNKNNKKSKKKNNHKPKEETQLLMPFENFEEIWQQWVEYKWTEHRFRFKSNKSEQTALHYLQKLSKNDKQAATEIIGFSIANGYKGLFPPRNTTGTKNSPSRDEFADYFKSGII
jgi:DNA-binding Lrp family transcriptional regulator